MKSYLLKMKLKGIKNIDKEIEINFYNKVLKKNFDLNESNIKAIYGANGAGKSAIVNAVDIYKKLILKNNFLFDNEHKRYLLEIINKKQKECSIEMTYLFYFAQQDNSIIKVFNHFINLEVDKNDEVIVKKEKLEILNRVNLNKKSVVYETEYNNIIYSDYSSALLEKHTTNLLRKNLISSIILHSDEKVHMEYINSEIEKEKMIFSSIYSNITFALDLNVEFPYEDSHSSIYNKNLLSFAQSMDVHESTIYNLNKNMLSLNSSFSINEDLIYINDKEKYLNEIGNLFKFVKIFKPSLKKIEVEFKENGEFLVCSKYFCYEGYRIYSDFESNGVKKLVSLYVAFKQLNNGAIVFIDELDANLHDVYLCKLLEYFAMYGKGQLCFTTHNLAPMEILSKRKHSIDFLSDDSQITSWVKQGNYSAVNLYRNGMISNSPFNIEPFEFLGVFEEGDNE